MNQDDIIRMAREAGIESNEDDLYATLKATAWVCDVDELEHFAALVAEHEREACAKLIEGGSFLHDDAPAARLAKEAAKAIRARGKK